MELRTNVTRNIENHAKSLGISVDIWLNSSNRTYLMIYNDVIAYIGDEENNECELELAAFQTVIKIDHRAID